ncbi:MAG: hypothetical protein GY940_15035, partial [bacterium]|nr:hypothetical protein [bacterium]
MQRTLFILLLLVNVLLLVGFNGCQNLESTNREIAATGPSGLGTPGSDPKPKTTSTTPSEKWQQMMGTNIDTLQLGDKKAGKGAVHVVSFHPQGSVRNAASVDEINVTFSEPVAPLKKATKDAPSLIQITPHLKGEGYWKSSTTYTYRLDEKPGMSSGYNVRFKGYNTFTGKTIGEKTWNFTTPTITIKRTKPYHKSKGLSLQQKILVQFTQNVDIDRAANFLTLLTSRGRHPFTVRYADEKERKTLYYYGKDERLYKRFIVIIPTGDLPMASDFQVRFLKGFPSLQGNLGMAGERYMQLRTYEKLKIISMSKQFRPDQGIDTKFTNPVLLKQFKEKITFEPAVEIEKDGNWTSTYISTYGEFMPGTTYTVTVPADLTDRFGNQLGQEQRFTVKCLDYAPYLSGPGPNHFVFEDYLDKKIPIDVRNVFNASVYYKKLQPEDLKPLFNEGYFDLKKMNLDSINKFLWEIPARKNRKHVLGFDLESINIKDPGYYYINFVGKGRTPRAGHIFQMTDVAMVAKYSPTQIFLAPFNMKTGELMPNLDFKIESFKKGGTLSGSVTGNDNGIAIYQPSMDLLKNNNLKDSFVFSEPGKSFVWGRKYEMIDMWYFQYKENLRYNYSARVSYNHLLTFTDKHLYKGGQTVKFKGIVRQVVSGPMSIPEVGNIAVEVINSRNQSLKKFTIDKSNVTAYGSFSGTFELPQDAPTGFYRIRLKVGVNGVEVNKTLQFSVQEYKPAKFEVSVSLDRSSIISGETVSGNINGRYLFGTPMKQATGNTRWTLQSTQFTPPGWKGYSFGTYDSQRRQTVHKADVTLDDGGNFKLKKDNLSVSGKNSARLTVHGEIKDKDNNRIAGSRGMMVHRGQYYIGLKTGSYFFKQNKPGKIMVVTVTPKGKPAKNTTANLKVEREEWKSFQKKDASGALRWDWKKLTHGVADEEISLPDGTFEKDYTFDKAGYYKVYLTGKDTLNNVITTTGYFYVTGSGYVSWGVNEGRTIDLVTDQNKYKAGDSVELLIKSPFESATVLVTVEREKVMWHKTLRMVGNAGTVNIPVQKDFMPNAFINVIILKERTGLKFDEEGKDIGKPEFYAGYKAITVDSSEKELTVTVSSAQEAYQPGDQVTLDIKVTDKSGAPAQSEVCLSVVDKGVLNLVNYQLPNPYDFFWRNRRLDVKTVSTLTDVLGRRLFKEKGEAPGGGVGGSAFGSVVVRKNFKESAFYTAFVETDESGSATVTFKLPDNLTTFKAMAVAGTAEDKFGRGDRDLLVKKNIILKPAVPNFSRPGDTYSAGVTVTNNWNKKLKINISVQSENVKRPRGAKTKRKVTLKPGETQPVWFRFKVDGTRTQQLTFKAVSGRFSDGLYQEVPVRLPQFVEAAANFGRVDQSSVTERIVVPEKTMRELDKAEITLASSAMVGVKRNFDVLREYPYDCLEQKLSKQYPLLGAGDFLVTFGLLDMKPEAIKKRIEGLLKSMPRYQDRDGGFKYYPDSVYPSPYLTCYVAEFILDAKKKGFPFDKRMLKRAQGYLKKVAQRSVDSKYPYSSNVSLLVQAYAVYVLARDRIFMGATINNLFEVRDRVPFSGLAYLVKALNMKNNLPAYMQPVLAKTMVNKMKDAPTMTHFENHEGETWWWVHESNVKTTAIVLDAFLEVYGRFPYAEKIARWLTRSTVQKRYLSTQDHIRLFMAFEHYYRVFEKETPDFVAEVLFNGMPKVKETFSGRSLNARTHAVALQDYEPGKNIDAVFNKQGTGLLYYLLRLKYFPIGEVAALDRGFKVEKTYKRLDGSVVTDNRFKAGEKYLVEVTVNTNMERPFVMLDDPLPGGMKVLNPNFKTGMALDNEKATRDSQWSGYWGNFYRSEIYFDRVQVFADYLRRGTHKWTYLVIATN